MTLFTSLPSGDLLEGLDVPADEGGPGYGLVLLAARQSLVFEPHFAVLGPTDGRGPMSERPGLLMNDRLSTAQPNDCCIAGGTVRMLASLDVGHGDLGGDMTLLSPLRRLCNP